MPPTFVTQLWASLADLDEMGPPIEALVSKTPRQKLKALRAASGDMAMLIRGRHALPLVAQLEELVRESLAEAQIVVTGAPEEALSYGVRCVGGGAAAQGLAVTVGHVSRDEDDAIVFLTEATTTLGAGATFSHGGLTWTFTGTLSAGATAAVFAVVDDGIGQHVVNIAAYNLVYNRGVEPSSEDGMALQRRYDAAVARGKDVQGETAKLDETRDATPNKRETRPRGGGQKEPWDFLDEGCS